MKALLILFGLSVLGGTLGAHAMTRLQGPIEVVHRVDIVPMDAAGPTAPSAPAFEWEPNGMTRHELQQFLYDRIKRKLGFPREIRQHINAWVNWFVDAGIKHGVDPDLLVAVAIHETKLQPFAVGSKGELSMLQLMTRYENGNVSEFGETRFATDASYREHCKSERGFCQGTAIRLAAKKLADYRNACGSVEGALSKYNSGSCRARPQYARRVLALQRKLEM